MRTGVCGGCLNACVDISDRKSLERRLQKAERMKSLGAMAAGIAHDFNNLLTSILGHGSLASECVAKESEAQQHIAASMECCATGKLADPKSAGVYREGRIILCGQRTWASDSIAATFALRDGRTERRRFDSTSLHKLPDVMADADEVRQLLRNLVLNAVEATASGRRHH